MGRSSKLLRPTLSTKIPRMTTRKLCWRRCRNWHRYRSSHAFLASKARWDELDLVPVDVRAHDLRSLRHLQRDLDDSGAKVLAIPDRLDPGGAPSVFYHLVG